MECTSLRMALHLRWPCIAHLHSMLLRLGTFESYFFAVIAVDAFLGVSADAFAAVWIQLGSQEIRTKANLDKCSTVIWRSKNDCILAPSERCHMLSLIVVSKSCRNLYVIEHWAMMCQSSVCGVGEGQDRFGYLSTLRLQALRTTAVLDLADCSRHTRQGRGHFPRWVLATAPSDGEHAHQHRGLFESA